MALTRKFLKAMGIEDEKVDQIIEAHSETVDALKEERDGYKADAEKLPEVQRQLEAAKKKAPKEGEETVSKADYDKLKAEFDQYKNDVQAKETHSKKVEAYKAILKDANLSEKGIEKAVRYAEWDKIELGEDGKLKGANDHIKAVREEWAEYVTTTTTTGAKTSTPPANNGGKTGKTKEEIMAIRDPAVRQAEIAKNPEAFGLKFD